MCWTLAIFIDLQVPAKGKDIKTWINRSLDHKNIGVSSECGGTSR